MIKLIESKEDIQKFIDKFGQENYDKLQRIKSIDFARDKKLADLTYCVKHFDVETLEREIEDCYKKSQTAKFNKRFGGALEYRFNKVRDSIISEEVEDDRMLDYQYWYSRPKRELIRFIREYGYRSEVEQNEIEQGCEVMKDDGDWKVYKITSYLASEYYGLGSGWCISGAYPGSYDRGPTYFEDYADTYYFIVNEQEDRRYCAFTERSRDFQVWDGSHGKDDALPYEYDYDYTYVPEDIQDYVDEIYDVEGENIFKVPETAEEQIGMIEDWMDTYYVDVDDFCRHGFELETCYDMLEDFGFMDSIKQDEEYMFQGEDASYQFSLLADYSIDIGQTAQDEDGNEYSAFDEFTDYQQALELLDRENDDFSDWAEEYIDARYNGITVMDYFCDIYGRNCINEVAVTMAEIFSFYDIAKYIVNDLGQGYGWCEDIINSR